jgi:hypothetical protein
VNQRLVPHDAIGHPGLMAAGEDPRAEYRKIIDALVAGCREGQGRIGADRARAGVWNPNALPDDHAFNLLLRKLEAADRDVLATLLQEQFIAGVHQTLVALHEYGVPPFDDAYEGTPFHDFVGRLDDWPWPVESP